MTHYVKISDETLNNLADAYKNADPNSQEYAFSIYLALEELKRFREDKRLEE